jgi:carbamoyltransferase
MKVLGISDGLTSGAALIEDGTIRYAVNEERLIRVKMATGFPRESICKVLEDTHTRVEDIDAIAIAMVNDYFREKAVPFEGWFLGDQPVLKEMLLRTSSQLSSMLGAKPVFQRSYYDLKYLLGSIRRDALKRLLRREWGFTCPIKFIDHHLAHASSAYFTSGWNEATVITMDGAGDNSSSRVYYARAGQLQKFCNVDSFNSLGNYYGYITHLCGFKAHRHEGKITGLAAYGEPRYSDILRRFITFENGATVNKERVFYWSAIKALRSVLPQSFKPEDLAASMQQVLEDIACDYIKHWVRRTGCDRLALAGGVFANVKLNQRIHELKEVRTLFVHPGMGDEGLAVGAALLLNVNLHKRSKDTAEPSELRDVYLGPEYSDNEILQTISRAGLAFEHSNQLEGRVAQLLAKNHVVARFAGRMEYGPRALGNRSILYQATDASVNHWLNKRLIRTEFMPFAPVTMAEYADQAYPDLDGASQSARFMTITVNCTDWMRKHCPAVVHVDGTARPQLIDRRTNPTYYKILEEYRQITGLSSLINTSFNMHEEPIVCSPEDAIRAFLQGRLDYLAIGNFLLKHPHVSSADRASASHREIHHSLAPR